MYCEYVALVGGSGVVVQAVVSAVHAHHMLRHTCGLRRQSYALCRLNYCRRRSSRRTAHGELPRGKRMVGFVEIICLAVIVALAAFALVSPSGEAVSPCLQMHADMQLCED